jgi:hypothetical protein
LLRQTTKQFQQARGKKHVHINTDEDYLHTFSKENSKTFLHDTLFNQQSTTGYESNDCDRSGETK